jgi:hypothetical protein
LALLFGSGASAIDGVSVYQPQLNLAAIMIIDTLCGASAIDGVSVGQS